ncbi:hypothetical protein NIES2119_08525 [[Phormidium ambiguum] IAM M-71]|uniref:Uncharacterized protein n=1 Tax=[Phormidium ambiguum] IAM M-71 TaxID=454136 RepID=A0A1U7IMY5_9CYAN|nr:hypothetical protein [Phormidium ambiguum]OKH38633.1 hypothetical protein NIES2119_08525 [Phormidium ambiguum IAM M-71]
MSKQQCQLFLGAEIVAPWKCFQILAQKNCWLAQFFPIAKLTLFYFELEGLSCEVDKPELNLLSFM